MNIVVVVRFLTNQNKTDEATSLFAQVILGKLFFIPTKATAQQSLIPMVQDSPRKGFSYEHFLA